MFDAISRSLLGQYGTLVLDFYLENQIIINLIVVAYGVSMIVIRRRRKNKTATEEQKENKE